MSSEPPIKSKRGSLLIWLAAIPVVLLVLSIVADQIPLSQARPPKSVTNIASFIAWKANPIATYQISVEGTNYFQATGPAGRYLASGHAAYTFDSNGNWLGWTSDMGDFRRPVVVFSPGAQRTKISFQQFLAAATNLPSPVLPR